MPELSRSVETCRRLTLHVLRRYSSCPSSLSVLYCHTSTLVAKELLGDFESEFIGASRNERIAGMTMYRRCLLLLAGFGLLGRDGGVDALPAIGCYKISSRHYLSVRSGSADCAEVASAIEKLPGVNADVECVRRRLRFGSPLRAWGNRNWATTVMIAVLALLDFVLLTCMRWHTHTHSLSLFLSLSTSLSLSLSLDTACDCACAALRFARRLLANETTTTVMTGWVTTVACIH